MLERMAGPDQPRPIRYGAAPCSMAPAPEGSTYGKASRPGRSRAVPSPSGRYAPAGGRYGVDLYEVDGTPRETFEAVVVGGNEITLGEDNSMSRAGDRRCVANSPIQAVRHSGGGQIAAFCGKRDGDTFLRLVDVTTGRPSEPIPLGQYSAYRVKGDLLVAGDKAGKLTAYRAA